MVPFEFIRAETRPEGETWLYVRDPKGEEYRISAVKVGAGGATVAGSGSPLGREAAGAGGGAEKPITGVDRGSQEKREVS
jgi:hypothetical protein